MAKISLSIALGLVAPIVVFMAAALVEVPGQNPPQERIAASLAAFLYLAICRFLVARMDDRKHGANWPSTVALCVPLLLLASVADARDLGGRLLLYAPPVVAGWLGIPVGAIAAARVAVAAAPLDACRRHLCACATVAGGVAVVVAGGVVPLIWADTSPIATPARAVPVDWAIAVFNLLVAAALALIAARAGRGQRPAAPVLALLAALAFVLACFLAPAVTFLAHGSSGTMAGILGVICSLGDLVVVALLAAAALRLPAEQPA